MECYHKKAWREACLDRIRCGIGGEIPPQVKCKCNMLNICTHCDINYFLKGLALYKSLEEQCSEGFTLHWLCNDDEIFKILERINLPYVILYKLSELEKDEALQKAKSNPASKYGTQYSQYMWTLTPYFISYLLPKIEGKLIYADADIYFYRDPKLICDLVGYKSVGIHSHRFTPPFKDTPTGWYNVGVLLFNNDVKGNEIVRTWADWLLGVDNKYYNKYGACGDQKYLDLFPELWGSDVFVFDTEACSHLAPWNCSHITHGENKTIAYNQVFSPVVFFHFSHFNINPETREWRDSNAGEWKPTRDEPIAKYYREYFGSCMSMYDKYLK